MIDEKLLTVALQLYNEPTSDAFLFQEVWDRNAGGPHLRLSIFELNVYTETSVKLRQLDGLSAYHFYSSPFHSPWIENFRTKCLHRNFCEVTAVRWVIRISFHSSLHCASESTICLTKNIMHSTPEQFKNIKAHCGTGHVVRHILSQ